MAGAIYETAAMIWAEMPAEYDLALEARYAEAEAATNGYMVNRLGRARGLTGYDLHTGSAGRAYRYASRELLDHWAVSRSKFVKVFPTEYKRALLEMHERAVLEDPSMPPVAAHEAAAAAR